MSARHPLLFVSHGAPDVLLRPAATVALWADLGRRLPRPQAILVVSAHWAARQPTVSTVSVPATIHDFGGFPEPLYAMEYPAPGAPDVAARVRDALVAAGLPCAEVPDRGLDHGAWIPLMVMYPAADIPVVQLALQPHAGPDWHRRIGTALRGLRDEGVLILASGAITHNFGWLDWSGGGEPLPQAKAFADWVGAAVARNDRPTLLEYRRQSPLGAAAHPSEEHLLPLFVTLGAADPDEIALRLEPEFTYGGLAMDAYLWQKDSIIPYTPEP
ncbi:MAG TPA: class III extradiol ring-cleavage dioxygenase [Rhodocyclaceae bacterium]|nr:class III extradiol ring-cleavage dioxygenase [Rhodocyclaceae bacterium]HNA68495.1 class III extradiol ring-cleavage dioxygenase [Rhodocyclaceae bacterium]HNF61178.1 class III extradiol ring-cleavage dioxygenase [Rhodocyclaceae bacterium]HNO88546.1 class III extradiol ring-cleavage dioxygenase [Rhodocyclaceae bacterium]